ncbi:MAG: ferrous iron transporter B, partial [Clostridiales bacterium]|nr:ferrous iron transporter B [Clostridiales bacterium]
VILMAFILGFPANEVVIPITIMAYMSKGSILELSSLESLKALFVQNGWTWITAICVMLFSLMHWPCSTALWTIKKETGSLKWTAIAFIIPTIIGFLLCFVVSNVAGLFV